jgi:hypothetical protein
VAEDAATVAVAAGMHVQVVLEVLHLKIANNLHMGR